MAALDAAMLWLSQWGILVPVFCVLLTRDKKAIVKALLSFAVAYVLTDVLKGVVARARPFAVGDAQLIGSQPADEWSFPSKHASLSFSLATSAGLARRVHGYVALIFAALISYSRVYLGVHYWSDIIAGAVLGTVVAFGVDCAFERFGKRGKRKRK